jgi:hypothetical protein
LQFGGLLVEFKFAPKVLLQKGGFFPAERPVSLGQSLFLTEIKGFNVLSINPGKNGPLGAPM